MDIRHDSAAQRFETEEDGQAAWLDYERDPDGIVTITHTIVPDALGGRGIGSALVRAAWDWTRETGVPLRSTCSFATAWLKRNA
ncbi:putative acetyltransferase [Acetobacter estunensis NRIC 0472]|uniref:N-acetyltransferase n=1 Tax=Acetobacter estunensis TaxID=104097 RepID=A0A967B7P3_9PROT|nr:GNAT family N-acetyltransferase [Acetobacter estunensis]NHO53696.1 N-acetyltransferase [Acetobacter estunensis]GBQ25253.1 putative acetyltransferase [Acetobacter estunensis NRIC 0472]